MDGQTAEFVQEYREYVQRFDAACGSVQIGAFIKHGKRLVKKLRYEEFEPKYREYSEMARTYFEGLERGDTINDLVVKLLRDFADELFLPSPV